MVQDADWPPSNLGRQSGSAGGLQKGSSSESERPETRYKVGLRESGRKESSQKEIIISEFHSKGEQRKVVGERGEWPKLFLRGKVVARQERED